MDDERFETLYRLVMDFAPGRGKRQRYGDGLILLVLLWSALRRKPRCWARDPANAPARLAGDGLPSASQLSRRLRSAAFAAFFGRFVAHALARQAVAPCLLGCFLIDARALPVNRYSKDRQALRGWAIDRIAKGYKLFLLADTAGRAVALEVHAMNAAEPAVALTFIGAADKPGYLLGDSAYDSNGLHLAAAERSLHLIAPRKEPGGNIGVRAAGEPRLRAIAMLETPEAQAGGFGRELYKRRTIIERVFSVMASSKVGLDGLPPWVRTLGRVRLWVGAMIVFYTLFAPAPRRGCGDHAISCS